MGQSSRTFRVFVSSTFSDLKEERNALQERVFPRLRNLCMQQGCRFQAIDLRWGVNEEAALDQQTMKVCIQEIERCQKISPRPNFIVILGDRYGWQPIPYEIPADEYEAIMGIVSSQNRRLLETWYRCDNNAAPPVYELQPRDGEYIVQSSWNSVENHLRFVLRRAVDSLSFTAGSRVKYFSSATEQEIVKGCLDIEDNCEHVFCFFRNFGLLPTGKDAGEFVDLNDQDVLDTDSHVRIGTLKDRLRKIIPENVHEYEASWTDGGATTEHLEKLCLDVYDKLARVIQTEITNIQQVDLFEKELADHETFRKEQAEYFVGRSQIIDSIIAYVKSHDNEPFCIYGPAGSGKSTVISHAIDRIRREIQNVRVICLFIGATPASVQIPALLGILCRQITRIYKQDESVIPTDYKELVKCFLHCLSYNDEKFPLVIFIDALDQLSNFSNVSNWTWLPLNLPSNVKIVVSVAETPEFAQCLRFFRQKLPGLHLIRLPTMSNKEGLHLLDLWLANARRILQPGQMEEVLSKFNGLPLHLKLVFEAARKWKSYSEPNSLSADIEGAIRDFFETLSLDTNYGHIMVSRSLGYLGASKNGLTEDELLDLLSLDSEVMEDFRRRSPRSPIVDRIPIALWSRFYLDLKPYLSERNADNTSLISFFHRQFGELVKSLFLVNRLKTEIHGKLAQYFLSQAYETNPGEERNPNYRKVSELPHQLMKAEMWCETEHTLTDFNFAMSKCLANMVEDLNDDYVKALSCFPNNIDMIQLWATFFTERIHILRRANRRWPAHKILLQLAIEHADESPITKAAEQWIDQGKCDWVWLKSNKRPASIELNSCVAVLEGHIGTVRGAFQLKSGDILSWADGDPALRLWNKNGALKAILEGHDTRCVFGALQLSDGCIVSWASRDPFICMWDQDGAFVNKLEGHTGEVQGVIELSEKLLVSWGSDCNIIVRDLNGIPRYFLTGHKRAIPGVLELTSGALLSWSLDHTLRIWSKNGRLINTLAGHQDFIFGAIQLSDDYILSWSYDGTLRLWENDGTPVTTFTGHTEEVTSAIELSDGNILSWSQDKTLRIWSRNGSTIAVLKGHKNAIRGAFQFSDGRIFSHAFDNTHRIWDQNGTIVSVHQDENSIYECLILKNSLIVAFCNEWWRYTINIIDHNGFTLCSVKGHTDFIVNGLELLDGQILSWSEDSTLRIWDTKSVSTILSDNNQHQGKINGVVELSDGRVLSYSVDGTLRIWHKDGTVAAILETMGEVWGALELRSDCIISWGSDNNLRIWDLAGKQIKVYDNFTNFGYDILPLSNHSLLSIDPAKIFNSENRSISAMDGSITWAPIEMSNSDIVAWSLNDSSLRIWDKSGILINKAEGHTAKINGISVLSGNQILSWSRDRTIRIWDSKGMLLFVLRGHTNEVYGAIELANRDILSWAADNTLRTWSNDGREISLIVGHTDVIYGAIELSNGNILSWSADNTLRTWSNDGRLLVSVEERLAGIKQISNSRLLSWSQYTIKIRNEDCIPLTVLEGHTDRVLGATELSDGRILSWSADNTLRIWRSDGRGMTLLKGHVDEIIGAMELFDGNILSWSADNTLRIWRKNGRNCVVLQGHKEWIRGAHQLKRGPIISWEFNMANIKCWATNGKSLGTLNPYNNNEKGLDIYIAADTYIYSFENIPMWELPDGEHFPIKINTCGTYEQPFSLILPNGNILSRIPAETLRIWNTLGELKTEIPVHLGGEGRPHGLIGVTGNRILSWEHENHTLCMWDANGMLLSIYEGHTGEISGALELSSGNILTWSYFDRTIRTWEPNGNPLEKHFIFIAQNKFNIAQQLPDGRIVFFSESSNDTPGWFLPNELLEFDHNGTPIGLHNKIDFFACNSIMIGNVLQKEKFHSQSCVLNDVNSISLLMNNNSTSYYDIRWQGNAECKAWLLKEDGFILVSESSGKIYFLHVYHGNKRITVNQFESFAGNFLEYRRESHFDLDHIGEILDQKYGQIKERKTIAAILSETLSPDYALWWAIEKGYLEVVGLALSQGANMFNKVNGMFPAQYALSIKRLSIVPLLIPKKIYNLEMDQLFKQIKRAYAFQQWRTRFEKLLIILGAMVKLGKIKSYYRMSLQKILRYLKKQ